MQRQTIDAIDKWECGFKRQSTAKRTKVKWFKTSIISPNDTDPITAATITTKNTAKWHQPYFVSSIKWASVRRNEIRTQNTHSSLNILLIDLIESFIVNVLSTCLFPHLDGENPEASERRKKHTLTKLPILLIRCTIHRRNSETNNNRSTCLFARQTIAPRHQNSAFAMNWRTVYLAQQ